VKNIGPGTSLLSKVTTAQAQLAAGNVSGACSTLTLFINQVRAQSGKSIPTATANSLIADARRVQSVIGC
jgi:hypothetical protein